MTPVYVAGTCPQEAPNYIDWMATYLLRGRYKFLSLMLRGYRFILKVPCEDIQVPTLVPKVVHEVGLGPKHA